MYLYLYCILLYFSHIYWQDRDQSALTVLSNHVVVCLFATLSSPLIGLRSLIMPLRASNFDYSELKHVVVVGDKDYVRGVEEFEEEVPRISILSVSSRNHHHHDHHHNRFTAFFFHSCAGLTCPPKCSYFDLGFIWLLNFQLLKSLNFRQRLLLKRLIKIHSLQNVRILLLLVTALLLFICALGIDIHVKLKSPFTIHQCTCLSQYALLC